jgi:signal transduction histidine kinase
VSLRARLFLAAVPVLLLFAAYNAFHLVRRERAQLVDEVRARAQAMADLLASNSAYALQTLNPTLLQSNANSAFLQPDVEYVSIDDPTGRVLASSDPSSIGQTAVFEEGADILAVRAPIELRGMRLGSVRLGVSTARARVAIAAAGRQVLVTSLLLMLAVAVLTGIAAHRLTLPLSLIAQTADQMAEGWLAARVPLGRRGIRGDLAPLAATFNRMAERLEQRVSGERHAHVMLSQRVSRLLDFTAGVAAGDLDGVAPTFADDDLGRLAADFNSLLARLRGLVAQEQSFREALEKSAHELEEAHARLSLADRQKTDFLVVVSHELRTPLTAVKAFAELLLDGVDDAALRREFLTIIQREAERLTRLINNLLDLSRIDAGRMNWRQDRISPSRLARMAADLARSDAEEKGVRLEVLVADDREIEGDAERLGQALFEVVGNAVHASDPGSAVRIYVADLDSDDRVGMVVEDRGCGIDPAHHVAIFERFWQVTRPTRGRELERPRGSGLGLPLAKAIVGAHRGTIVVEAIADGPGTRVMITLPLRRPLRVASLLPFAEPYLGRMVDAARWRDLLNKLLEKRP